MSALPCYHGNTKAFFGPSERILVPDPALLKWDCVHLPLVPPHEACKPPPSDFVFSSIFACIAYL